MPERFALLDRWLTSGAKTRESKPATRLPLAAGSATTPSNSRATGRRLINLPRRSHGSLLGDQQRGRAQGGRQTRQPPFFRIARIQQSAPSLFLLAVPGGSSRPACTSAPAGSLAAILQARRSGTCALSAQTRAPALTPREPANGATPSGNLRLTSPCSSPTGGRRRVPAATRSAASTARKAATSTRPSTRCIAAAAGARRAGPFGTPGLRERPPPDAQSAASRGRTARLSTVRHAAQQSLARAVGRASVSAMEVGVANGWDAGHAIGAIGDGPSGSRLMQGDQESSPPRPKRSQPRSEHSRAWFPTLWQLRSRGARSRRARNATSGGTRSPRLVASVHDSAGRPVPGHVLEQV